MSDIEFIYNPNDSAMKVAVLVSGSGTNFLAIHDEQLRLEKSGEKNYGKIEVVFTNVPNCKGAEKAKDLGIPVLSLSSKSFFEILNTNPDNNEARDFYDAATITLIEGICKPDIVALAGYRRRIGGLFLSHYKNRIVNLYPGDITKRYLIRGVDASIQALRAGEGYTKCTVFLEKASERFGPSIVQSQPISLEGYEERDAPKIQEKIRKEGEWRIYPFAIHQLTAKGRLGIDQNDNIYVDGKRMPERGYQFKDSDLNFN
jgi:phosphoribosylglycinamide formyltransferase 1